MMNILRHIAKSIPMIVVLLVVVELIWSNTLVGSGKKVGAVDLAILDVQRENAVIATQIASASALSTISAKAQELGLVEPKQGQFVMIGGDSLPVALNRP